MTIESPPSPAVQMRGITKRFPGVLANDHVDLEVYPGEVMALLGENGAGKSTLMNILSGLYRPDQGEILIHGRPIHLHSPRDAIANGVGMVHQHFMLVETLTVAENVILGLDTVGWVPRMEEVHRRIEALSEQYGLRVDPAAYIWQLSVGEQQRVEILKLLYRGADILILDEPTAVLTPQESAELSRTLRRMADEGKAVIFITHKLDEVMAFADRVTVLRAGKVVATLRTAETNKAELARLMVGREVLFRLEKRVCRPGEIALEVENLQALSDKGLPALRGVSFQICAGEILGIAGVAGNGQRELAEVITGLRRATGGSVRVYGQDITNCSPREVIEAGVSHIPGDRVGVGLVPNLPVSDNLAMKAYRHPPLARGPLLDRGAMRDFARRLIEAFRIATPSPQTPVRLLSGGNQQRVVLAREITASKGVLVAVYPTRGLDVGATEAVRRSLLDERDRGAAILLISEDLDELMQLSDRIAVIYEGEIMGVVVPEETTPEAIGLLMAGQRAEEKVS
ncbi:MAG TPA: ABC transporter ATP-binding protein [Anaerolineales bacterium]|nr:ABC transporter ATP-binding protein [Anaerolineales bacterium]